MNGNSHRERRTGTSVADLDRRYYGSRLDQHVRFEAMVRRRLRPEAIVLDVGAGDGTRYPNDHRDRAALVVGMDLDPAVGRNTWISAPVRADIERIPLRDASVDVIVARYVLEHVARPVAAFREMRRVLAPDGHLLLHTPNRWHYVALAATITPHAFHEWFAARRGIDDLHAFPTHYRANDRRSLRAIADRTGFALDVLEVVEPKPEYLSSSGLAYRAGIAYERLVNSTELLADLRCVLLADLRAVPPSGRPS